MENNDDINSVIKGYIADYKCEKCGNTQQVNLFPYINFSDNPEYYALVKDRSIFTVKCKECGAIQEINFDILIVDETHKYFIYVLSDRSVYNKFKYQITYFVETSLNRDNKYDLSDYKTRLVFDHNDLIEKIAIFEADLNDEIIEIIKEMMYKSNHVKENVYDKLYFDGLEKTKLKFVAFSSKSETIKPEIYFIDFKLYNNFIDKISNLNVRHKDYFEVIDKNWVIDYLKIDEVIDRQDEFNK